MGRNYQKGEYKLTAMNGNAIMKGNEPRMPVTKGGNIDPCGKSYPNPMAAMGLVGKKGSK